MLSKMDAWLKEKRDLKDNFGLLGNENCKSRCEEENINFLHCTYKQLRSIVRIVLVAQKLLLGATVLEELTGAIVFRTYRMI